MNWWSWKIVAIVAIVINIGMTWVAYYFYRQNLVYENPYPLLDLSRNFITQEHFLTNIQSLRTDLKDIVTNYQADGHRVSVYIEFLNSGANISINQDTGVWPASLSKLPLALAVMKKVENQDWQFHNELVLMPQDVDDKSGDSDNPLSEFPVGTKFTIEKLLEELLINSDNTAYHILKRNLHQDELNRVIEDLGMQDLFNEDGRMSAKEYSRFFRSLYVSSFLKRENSQKILKWLDQSEYDEYLSNEISSQVAFPHKYGENIDLNVYSDSGIVYVPHRPYLITVMFEGNNEKSWEDNQLAAQKMMREISGKTFTFFSAEKQ